MPARHSHVARDVTVSGVAHESIPHDVHPVSPPFRRSKVLWPSPRRPDEELHTKRIVLEHDIMMPRCFQLGAEMLFVAVHGQAGLRRRGRCHRVQPATQ